MHTDALHRAAPAASYDAAMPGVVIRDLVVADPAVVTEALRWSTGRRGDAVTSPEMAGADLSGFATQALVVGAHAITSAGGTAEKFDLERLVTELGTRTTEASARAVEVTTETATRVATAMQQASETTKKIISEAGEDTRKALTDNVNGATKSLRDDLQRLLGGDHPELVDRLNPLLEAFGQKLDARAAEQSRELLAKAARQFDPADPTSPMAKHAKALDAHQASLSRAMEVNHLALAAKVDELATAVKVSTSARETAATLIVLTPLKGGTYADAVHAVMHGIAGGLGDEYADTGSLTGSIPRSKKGDGVLTVDGGAARLVLEMTDSSRTVWNEYLEEAERNREAAASLGLVRSPAQNGGHTIRCLGARRIVMAFDPDGDDPQLLRTVVQLLRVAAISACARRDSEDVQTAQERIGEALAMLVRIDEIQRAAGTIRKGADKIETQCSSLHTGLNRLLNQAKAALEGVAHEVVSGSGTASAA